MVGGVLTDKGRYRARLACSVDGLAKARALRSCAFAGGCADQDCHDMQCDHVLVEDMREGGKPVCSFRLFAMQSGAEIGHSYSAQFYDLSALQAFDRPVVEMGRFCIQSDRIDPDILRVAWAAMAVYVDRAQAGMLIGCSSFAGTETAQYLDAFAMLKHRHLAPKRWLPRIKAPDVFRYASRLRRYPDEKKAMLRMPPLLRSYLMMGGWVSDHAVVDRHMNTLHVFTGVEIEAIPPARKRLLRAAAG